MTTFQDLQAQHEALLNRHEAPADPTQFWADVQSFIDRVRNDAYFFWVNNQRLPERSNNQFTVESQGCQPVRDRKSVV
jgi:hypothetical protein